MLKNIRLPLFIIMAMASAMFFFSIKINFLTTPICLAIHKVTGENVRVSGIDYRLFNRISLRNVELGDFFRCQNVTISVDPFRLLVSPRHPQNALTLIHFERPVIVITPSLMTLTKKMGSSKDLNKSSRLSCSWENAMIIRGKNRIEKINGRIVTGASSGGAVAAVFGSHHFSARFQSRGEKSLTTGWARVKLTGPDTHIETTVNFIQRPKGIMTLTADINRCSWKNIVADHSTMRFNTTPKGVSFVLKAPGGSCSARGPSIETFKGTAFFQLASLTSSSSGTVAANFSLNNNKVATTLRLSDISYRSKLLGSLAMTVNGVPGGLWIARGEMSPAGYRFTMELSPARALSLFFENGRGSGMIMGRLDPLSLNVSVTNWPMDNAPLVSSFFPTLKGSLSVEGSLSPRDTRILANGSGWAVAGSGRSDWSASVYQTSGTWFLKAFTPSQSFKLNARRLSDGEWDTACALRRVPLSEITRWGGLTSPVSGNVSADISYSSQGNGKARVSASHILWPGGGADSASFVFLIKPDKAELVACDVRCPGGAVSGTGMIERSPDKPHTFSLNLISKGFSFRGLPVNGSLVCAGALVSGLSGYCKGSVEGKQFSWGPWSAHRILIPFTADKDRIELKSIHWDRIARGSIALERHSRTLSGELILADVPIGNVYSQLKGHLSGRLSLSGQLSKPNLRCDYSVNGLSYHNVEGKGNGTLFWQNNTLSTPGTTIKIGEGTILLNGTFWPSFSASGVLRDIPFSAARLAGIQQYPLKGLLSGTVQAQGHFSNPEFSADISGHGLSVGSLIVNDLSARLHEKNSIITIDTFSAKAGDAELCLLKGSSIDLKQRTFVVRSDWRNIDTGPAVIFGALSLTGSWDKAVGSVPVITGSLTTDNLWINEYHVEKASIGMRYSGKKASFEPIPDQPIAVTGVVDFNEHGLVTLHDLTFARDNRKVNARGTISTNKWDVILSARGADAETLGGILGLPVSLTGSIDADITGRGSLNAPDIRVSLSIVDGSIEELPFDKLILKGSARNDILTLEEARLARKNQYSAVARGTAPFYLTKESRNRVLKYPLDLSLTIEQGTLDLLSALTRDIRSGTGNINAQAHLTGTLSHPLANGFIKVNDGTLTGRRYFSKIMNMNADIEWKGTVLTVRDLSGKIGSGRLNVIGTIDFDGFKPSRYDLKFQTEGKKGIPISVPELPIPSQFLKTQDWDIISNLTHGEPRIMLRFSGPAQNPVLSGWVDMENTRFTYPSVAKPRDGESFFDPLWPKMSWDLQLRSAKNTWYDNELVSAMIQGGIRLTGRGLRPSVSGKVETVRGTINYLGTEFKIKQAQLEIFNNTAYLEGEASADVLDSKTPGQADTIQMFIDKSEIGKITPRFVSKEDPNLSPEQALARATGVIPERYSSADRDYMMRQQLVRLFDSTLTTPLARTLLKKSGLVDTFRVKYLAQEPLKPLKPGSPTLSELLYGTTYSLEKYLTTQMLFGYSMTFDQLQNKLDLRHELELSYQLNRSLFLRGSYELDTSNNPFRQYDRRITLEQQFRFGFSGRGKKPKNLP